PRTPHIFRNSRPARVQPSAPVSPWLRLARPRLSLPQRRSPEYAAAETGCPGSRAAPKDRDDSRRKPALGPKLHSAPRLVFALLPAAKLRVRRARGTRSPSPDPPERRNAVQVSDSQVAVSLAARLGSVHTMN